MVLPEKNLSSPPPQKKRKALGLALSVKKNSGLARPKKKELAPFEIKNRGASPIRQGQALIEYVTFWPGRCLGGLPWAAFYFPEGAKTPHPPGGGWGP